VRITVWGTRGSLATPGPETNRYGGNTSCVQVQAEDGTALVLDAGTGIRRLGNAWPPDTRRVDILLSHLHMDHILGLGFFEPLHDPDMEVHIWGPPSNGHSLRMRLQRYLSPPLFPVHLRDLPCQLTLHEVTRGTFHIGGVHVAADLVIHPGPTLGYRITEGERTVTYLPDHEPALGEPDFPHEAKWTSGYALAENADLLIHDSQYSLAEYPEHIGWGHSAIPHTLSFACLAQVKHLVLFHHDPMHTDEMIDRLMTEALDAACPPIQVTPAREGAVFELPPGNPASHWQGVPATELV
jgi:ribonuclease BN (tRNA processing enzyme)